MMHLAPWKLNNGHFAEEQINFTSSSWTSEIYLQKRTRVIGHGSFLFGLYHSLLGHMAL